ncbi:hypothetical protein ACFQY0_04725 [Haloferula chungangensis]|uniref:Uncharacterized protein n=1 Tax=Haloferula chungangensis TaxID=1048331 RepID=A0ABW2L462_9BACT
MATLLTFTQLVPLQEAAALAPQDSTHLASTIEKLPDEIAWHNVKVANQRVYYTTTYYGGADGTGKIRARNFVGDLVFDLADPKARPDMGYGVSSDGRLYHFISTPQQYTLRVAIVAPDGTRLGDFGPTGQTAGTFDTGNGTPPEITVSPATGRIYVSDENAGSGFDPAKKGSIRVFDRDGNFLHEFQTTGILASTLEGSISHLLVRGDAQGKDELFVVDTYSGGNANFKVFGGDGQFRRLVTGGIFGPAGGSGPLNKAFLWGDRLVIPVNAGYNNNKIHIAPATVTDGSEVLTSISISTSVYVVGMHDSGGWIGVGGAGASGNGNDYVRVYSYPNFSNFDAVTRNAVPNPWVLRVTQRPGSGIVDLDYQVDDLNDSKVTTALIGFADGVASLNNVLPLKTVIEGTAGRIGANQPSGVVQRVTWNAGADWNVDFGTLRVMALARDSRSHWFDVHLVEIPADGQRPAVTISRNPLRESDFLAQFLWLVATKDASVELIDGVLFGTSGAYDGVILANGSTATAVGREFLLKRDGLRVATAAEITRAREGATPGFEVKLTPPVQMQRTHPEGSFPDKINEFGVESGSIGTAWYVVRESAN